jgi:transporter family-2 protein
LPTDQPERHVGASQVAGAALAVGIGVLAAWQSHLNGEMAGVLHDAREAAALSFFTGLVILSVLVATRPELRRGLTAGVAAFRGGRLAWWQLLGGLGGATFIAGQTVVVPRVGVALFTVAAVGAQTANSLLVDKLGLGPAGKRPISVARVVAALVAVIAVVVSVWGREGTFSVGPLLLAVVGGGLLAVQLAVNGRVAVAAGEPLVAAWVNFVVGFAGLLVLYVVGSVIFGDGVHALPRSHWLLYLTGPIGVVFVTSAAWLVRVLGVLLFSLCAVAGQVAGAVIIDLLAPTPAHAVTATTYVGVGLTVLAVAIGSGLLRRRRSA